MKNLQLSIWEVPRYKLSTGSNPDLCRKCNGAIWRLICQAGFTTQLDTNRLNFQDQLDCYLAKIPTYRIDRIGDGFIANFRTKTLMLATKETDVILKTHSCYKTPNTTWPDYWQKTKTTKIDGIPF